MGGARRGGAAVREPECSDVGGGELMSKQDRGGRPLGRLGCAAGTGRGAAGAHLGLEEELREAHLLGTP